MRVKGVVIGGWMTRVGILVAALGMALAARAGDLHLSDGDWGQKELHVGTAPRLGYILESANQLPNWVVLRQGEGDGSEVSIEDWVAPVLSRRF
ncbi:MAG TPA: hypothetical protein VEH27_16480, partial [Methylomirabilota bacterium]|nr:hypothetical protein [Methylomirabilota bacterium]